MICATYMHKSLLVVCRRAEASGVKSFRPAVLAVLGAISVLISACNSGPVKVGDPVKVIPDVQTLNEGDVIKIAFPTTGNLDDQQQIRRDGRINLKIIGEIRVVGKTPAELEVDLIKAYASELVSKEIKVTVISSAFAVYVSGAVLRPGKVIPERPLTAFDAIMEAGGLAPNANPKKVRVIRQEDGQVKTYPLDMKKVIDGKTTEPFYLKSHDTVHVPDKIQWF